MILRILFFLCFINTTLSISQTKEINKIKEDRITGKYGDVIRKSDSLLNLKKSFLTALETSELYLEKVRVFRITEEFDNAKSNLDSVYLISKTTNNKQIEANYWLEKYRLLSFYKSKESLTAMANLLSIAKEINSKKFLYITYRELAQIAQSNNEIVKAKKYLKKAYYYNRAKAKKTQAEGNLNYLSALIFIKEEKFDSAKIFIGKSLSIKKELENNRGVLQLYFLEGIIQLQKKDYENVFISMEKTHKLAKKINSSRLKDLTYSHIFNLLSVVDKKNPLYKKTLEFFNVNTVQKAIKIVTKKAENFKDYTAQKSVFEALSKLHKTIGNKNKSLSFDNKVAKVIIKEMETNQLNAANFIDLELRISEINLQKENLKKEQQFLKAENELNFKHKIILVLTLILLLFFGLFIWSQLKLKIKNGELDKLEVERNLLIATKERIELENTIKQKELELNSFIRDMIEKNSQIEILQNQLKKSNSNGKNKLTEELKSKKSFASKNWMEFMFKFTQLHPNFSEKLKESLPNISPTETKLSVLAFLNLTSKEIGHILGISATSVNQGKYRLKKKIDLDKELSLNDFLQKL